MTCFVRMQPVAVLAVQAGFAMVQCGLEVATEFRFKITSDRPHLFGEMPRALHALRQKVYRYRHQQLELKFWASYIGVFVIGLGSVAFHGTLLRWGQVLDEVPMLWASLCFLYVGMTMEGTRPVLAA